MNVRTYGASERLKICREYLKRAQIASARNIVLLPIPTTRDGMTVTGTEETLRGVLDSVIGSDVVVGYGLPQDFREGLSERGAVAIDVCRDEKYLSENADLTAIGTLGRILCEEGRVPCEMSIGIIGYGRIGERLVRYLMFLGADVTVFTSRSSLCRELGMIGVKSVCTSSLEAGKSFEELSRLEILINTAPAPVIPIEAKEALSGTRIIELASGNNFPEDMNVARFASVPAVMYPKSAGRVLAECVLRMLGEDLLRDGE